MCADDNEYEELEAPEELRNGYWSKINLTAVFLKSSYSFLHCFFNIRSFLEEVNNTQ